MTGTVAPAPPLPAAPPTPPPQAAPPQAARWRNPWRALPRVRAGVQAAYLAFLLVVGWQFARFAGQVAGGGPVTAARPPAVEAFLPIAALLGLRRWLATGAWDEVHPAGLVILLSALATALLARKAFCSWVCPVGTISEILASLSQRLFGRKFRFEDDGAHEPRTQLRIATRAYHVRCTRRG